jgi:ATP-binding cassette subfamily B protein
VFDRIIGDSVEIVDPALGRRRVPRSTFARSFTGVAVVVEPVGGFERRKPTGNPLWSYLRRLLSAPRLVSRVVLTSILLRLLALALPLLTAIIVDHVVPRGDTDVLWVVAIGLGVVVAIGGLATLIRAHLLLQLRTSLDVNLTLGFLAHLVALPFAFFQRRSIGDLMMRVASNANIRETLTNNTLSALLDGALVLVYLGLLFHLNPTIGLVTLGLGALQLLVFGLARRRVADLMAENLQAQARAQGCLVQILGGIETLKAAGAEGRALENWSNLFVDELNVSLERGRLQAVIDAAMAALKSASPFAILTYGALLVTSGEMSLGTMLATDALAIGFITPLSSLVDSALAVQRLGGYIERIDDVMAAPVEQERDGMAPAPRLSGKIQVRNLSFRYDAQSPLVVRDVDLDVEPGECVAIVGRSGSGKSTLASLLLGLQRPTAGTIRYDGHDIENLELRSLRRQLGIVPQRPYIFGQSIRDNIAIAQPGASLDRIVLAAHNASIHHEIAAMPMGYDTMVSDDGASLSGGQRQRLALARVLLNVPPIVVLDEATSSLDARTEELVMRQLAGLSCARIIIAHRLSTIAFADKIVVMAEGGVADVGTHDQLLSRCTVYRDLVAATRGTNTEEARHA